MQFVARLLDGGQQDGGGEVEAAVLEGCVQQAAGSLRMALQSYS
jgi:hypothetical protein